MHEVDLKDLSTNRFMQAVRNRKNKKLDYAAAKDIMYRMLKGESSGVLRAEYNCSRSLPGEIYAGRTWKDARKAAMAKFRRERLIG